MAGRWTEALGDWAIPDEILAGAAVSPWAFVPDQFVDATRRALAGTLTPTHRAVSEVLPPEGVLLDVGCGAGAASLPVAPSAGRIVAVDQDPRMLEAFGELAAGRVLIERIEGRWPEVAGQAGDADVAVCANVAYNVGDLGPFLEALTAAARLRVVLELGAMHPQTALSPLWERFWSLPRPARPTADDAEDVVREVLRVTPRVSRWTRERSTPHDSGRGAVERVRRRLCLPPERDAEIAAALDQLLETTPSAMVTMWWPGRADRNP